MAPLNHASRDVLLVGNFLHGAGGAYGICEEQAEEFGLAGWHVLTTSHKRPRLARLIDMVGTIWRLRREYRVAQVAVFSGSAFIWAEAACWMLRRAGKPYVLTLHGGALPTFARRWPRRVRALLKSANAVTTPSRYLLEEMAGYRNDCQMIPNAMRIDHYEFRLRSAPAPRLVWLRSFHEIYNPSLVPRVLAILQDEFPDVQIVMAGPDRVDGSLGRMVEMAAALGVVERILLPGAVAKLDVSTCLNQGDIFLNTTNIDNTPVSVIEALACGLCVVSTNVGGLPYLLKHEDDALLVPPDRPEEMAAAVRRILTDPDLAARLSSRGRERAEAMDWGRVIAHWNRLLMAVATGERSGPSRAVVAADQL